MPRQTSLLLPHLTITVAPYVVSAMAYAIQVLALLFIVSDINPGWRN